MAALSSVGSMKKYFATLKDPRVRGRTIFFAEVDRGSVGSGQPLGEVFMEALINETDVLQL